MFLPPTEEQAQQLRALINQANPDAILAFLQANPDMTIDSVLSRQSLANLYMEIMFHAGIQANNPLVAEVLRRRPNPLLKDRYGKTARNIAEQRALQFADDPVRGPRWAAKAALARQYEEDFLREAARNTGTLMSLSRNGLPTAPNTLGVITEYLSGEKGGPAIAMSKLHVKAGQPGVAPRGGKKTRRSRKGRKQTRKQRY